MNKTHPLFKLLKNKVFHSTSINNFESILKDEEICGGLNENIAGFCQHHEGFGKIYGPTISLSDLSFSHTNLLTDIDANWDDQLIQPWGINNHKIERFIYAQAKVTIILNRMKLKKDCYHTYDIIKQKHPEMIKLIASQNNINYCTITMSHGGITKNDWNTNACNNT